MNTANRILWIVIGLVLLALGTLGALASKGILDGFDPSRAVLPAGIDNTWRSWGAWAVVLSIAIGVVAALIGATLLRAETRTRGAGGLGELTMVTRAGDGQPLAPGKTRISGRTLTQALTADLSRNRHIASASAQLVGTASDSRLLLHLDVTPGTDLSKLRDVVDGAVRRFETTTGLHPQLGDIDVRFSDPATARVR